MRVFIGSSTESNDSMREIATWLEEEGHDPMPWDESFSPGDYTFQRITEISKQVDAAIFVFSEDDKSWYRGDPIIQPRDNVLMEYGLFAGQLGKERAIVCRKGEPKNSTDLHGIVYVDLNKPQRARRDIIKWVRGLKQPTATTNEAGLLERTPQAVESPVQVPGTSSIYLVSKISGKCLDVTAASYEAGAKIIQHFIHGGKNQKWMLEPVEPGYYRIVSTHSGKYLDVVGGSRDNAIDVIQNSPNEGDSQKWSLQPAGNGFYRIIAKHSDRCLDVWEGSEQDGARIVQHDIHDGGNQMWLLLSAGALTPP